MAGLDYKQVSRFHAAMDKLGRGHEADSTIIQAVDQVSHFVSKRMKNLTKVGIYPKASGKTGGTLKRNWKPQKTCKHGDIFEGIVYNPVKYAPYVEFGHRTRLGQGKAKPKKGGKAWVEGKKNLDKVLPQASKYAPAIIQNAIIKKLNEVIK